MASGLLTIVGGYFDRRARRHLGRSELADLLD